MMSMSVNRADLDGLVLLGGKSSRMGSPKAHLIVQGRPQWRRCQEALMGSCHEVFLSISPHLIEVPPVSEELLLRDVFSEPIGPLGGLISAFKKNRARAYLVLACDLFGFTKEAAQSLIERRNPKKYATAFVDGQGRIEPLCGIYEPQIFAPLMQAWACGEYCPRKILTGLEVEKVAPKYESWIANMNCREEYAALARLQPVAATKEVFVSYYAAMREVAGKSQERLSTQAQTVGELFSLMKAHYRLALTAEQMRFAKNEALVLAHEPLFEGDRVVFIPPVSGG